jgi:hypothetical protein
MPVLTKGLLALLVQLVVIAVVYRVTLEPHEPGAPGRRPDGCIGCHANVTGLGDFHRPADIGCAACHGGDVSARLAADAHAGMVRVPGNLDDVRRTCGRDGCHAAIVPRIERSIMATMAGVITADRRVLGEPVDHSAPPPHANQLGTSVADSHLRELCVSCHLGQAKTEWGPIGERSQGGGCNACHLVYGAEAEQALARYLATPERERKSVPSVHPSFALSAGNGHCFGCHSRSSRIATNYEGWNELRGEPAAGADARAFRRLDDGRWFERVTPDVHHERGLECIDCHIAAELMGAGALVTRKADQLRIGCSDCHAAKLRSVSAPELDAESRMLLALRRWVVEPTQRFATTRSGDALVNVFVDDAGRGRLRRKRTGEFLPLKPPLAVCTGGRGHARLGCASCHSAWAPRCTTCHTEFDPNDEGFDHLAQKWVPGTWNESSGRFEAALPTLGIRLHRDAEGGAGGAERGAVREVVETFVPGMILTFDRNRERSGRPDVLFRRLYGPTFAHTVRREARSCTSCHADPVALGYGRGSLRFDRSGASGRWRFQPSEPMSPHDGLPADAWIGFLREREGMVSASEDVRPFNVAEQRRVLRAGSCLACHAGDSVVMRQAIDDFDAVFARRSPRCPVPSFR